MVSCAIQAVATGASLNVASRMVPVSPMPPIVATKRSTFSCGEQVLTSPLGRARSNELDMMAEAAGAMMILAVDVGGDHAADGDEFGAGNDGREKAARQKGGDDIAEQDARLDGEARVGFVKVMEAVKAAGAKTARRANRGVAIGPAVAARDGAVEVALQARRLGKRGRRKDARLETRIAAPAS